MGEGTDVRFKSCSNSHIDVEIHDGSALTPTRKKVYFVGTNGGIEGTEFITVGCFYGF